MTKKILCHSFYPALAIAFLLLFGGPAFSASSLTQEGYADLSRYSGLTNFDLDQNGNIYAIADRKSGARLVRLDGNGNETAYADVTDGAEEISVSPSGNAVFYRISGQANRGSLYRTDLSGTNAVKSGFTHGSAAIELELSGRLRREQPVPDKRRPQRRHGGNRMAGPCQVHVGQRAGPDDHRHTGQ